jgi:hypothetical protein
MDEVDDALSISRAGRFSTELFERYQRSEWALVATFADPA